MQLLLLGGTVFLGRTLAEQALERGHSLTLFHRGTTHPDLFPDLEHIIGDRAGDHAALAGRSWDAVIDTSGMCSPEVRQAALVLQKSIPYYCYVSSISVYADLSQPQLTEAAPVATMEGSHEQRSDMTTYGARKARCEAAVREIYPQHHLIIRPGMIVGPYDPTDRFTYWAQRMQQGGRVLAPQPAEQPVQLIDVRDLSSWMLNLIEKQTTGTFHATGQPQTMRSILEACRGTTDAELVWVPAATLLEQAVVPFSDLPFWLANDPDYAGMFLVTIDQALEAGLTFRPLETTVRDLLAWKQTPLSTGLAAQQEQAILTAYQQE